MTLEALAILDAMLLTQSSLSIFAILNNNAKRKVYYY